MPTLRASARYQLPISLAKLGVELSLLRFVSRGEERSIALHFHHPKSVFYRFVAGREDFLACWRFEWILKYGGLDSAAPSCET